MGPRRRRLLESALSIAVAWVVVGPPSLSAQIILKRGALLPQPAVRDGSEKQPVENVFIQPERNVLQQLAKARELLKQERYGDAVRYLGTILETPEDCFFRPDRNSLTVGPGLKAEAQRLIGEMPRQGLELYQAQFGARAQQKLTEAKNAGDVDLLAEVSRRFFHTPAGYEATFLLGLHHCDRARPLAAALILQRLRDSAQGAEAFEPALSLTLASCWLQVGLEPQARAVLVELKSREADHPLKVGGREVRWFASADKAPQWLAALIGPQQMFRQVEADRWAMFRGNAARNAQTVGSAPLLNLRWEVPVGEELPGVEAMLRQVRQVNVEQDATVLPGLHPLAIDNVILMRTSRKLLALDFTTGKRLWDAMSNQNEDDPLRSSGPDAAASQPPQTVWALGQRLWQDATYGTISSDGRLVFTIDDLPLNAGAPQRRALIMARQGAQSAPVGPCNRLAARDIHNGKIKWQVGGVADQFALPLAETFFLGPPLPLDGRLYVLAESKGQGVVSLLALDPGVESGHRGKLLWSQALAVVESELPQDAVRRMSGLSPSYADGILVCPTSVGAVVAVDLATRSLLWGYNYRRSEDGGRGRAFAFRFNGMYNNGQIPQHRWVDATVTVADGRVLVSPIESDLLYCLNLPDGKLLWSCPRKDDKHDDLYLACVQEDNVVLVGRREVHAVSLTKTEEKQRTIQSIEYANGMQQPKQTIVTSQEPKPVWSAALPEGSMPSGRGFLAGRQYFVPLSSAEVATIDLASGRISRTAKSRKGSVPGNLICYQGMVVSQGLDSLEAFFQLDAAREEVARRLAADKNDAEALSLRGEILLDEGKQAEAIACFRDAYETFRRAAESDGAERTRTMLRDALLDGLRLRFADNRGRTEEIERLLDDDSQRAAYLRLMATGLRQSGEWLAAFEHYAKLVDLDRANRQTEPVSPTLSVRRDRWVQAQVASLRSEVKDAKVSAEIEKALAARLDAAVQSGKAAPLRQFLDYFGHLPAGAREKLIQRLIDADRLLEAEQVLWRDQRSTDAAVAGPAVAELAELLRKAGRSDDAAACYRRLAKEFAGVVCRDGKTGAQWVDALPDAATIRQPAAAAAAWPVGLVECNEVAVKGARQPSYGRFALKYDEDPGPFFDDTLVQFDQSPSHANQRRIVGYDGWGSERWHVALDQAQHQNLFYNRNMSQVNVHGHLLLLSMGYKLLAIDALGGSDRRGPRLLWDQDLAGPNIDPNTMQAFPFPMAQVMPWGVQTFGVPRFNSRMSPLGPTTSRYLCYQRMRNLVAIDPINGEVLWAYHNLPPACDLFGDDELVFALPFDKDKAQVFRALDGQLLGERSVPRVAPPNVMNDNRGQPLKYMPFNQCCIGTLGRRLLLWHEERLPPLQPGGATRPGPRTLQFVDPWEEAEKGRLWEHKFAAGAVVDVVGSEVVGVCEPDGNLVLLSLPDGRAIAHTKLEVDSSFATLSQMFVLPSNDQYVVLTHNPPRDMSGLQRRNVQPLPGMMSQQILRGWVFAFDKHGRQIWPEAVKVEYQQINLDQPRLLPVLVFACQEYIRENNSNGQSRVSVLCLDKRNGRKLYQKTFPNTTATFDIVGDPKQHKVELRMQQNTVLMSFTDKPLPPPPPPEKKTAEPLKPGRVLNALRRAVERVPAIGIPVEDEEEELPFIPAVPAQIR